MAAFAIRTADMPELPEAKFPEPIEVLISGSALLYELDTPPSAGGQPVPALSGGGCTINLVEQEHAEAFAKSLGERYAAKTGIVPQIHVCHASDGAHQIK